MTFSGDRRPRGSGNRRLNDNDLAGIFRDAIGAGFSVQSTRDFVRDSGFSISNLDVSLIRNTLSGRALTQRQTERAIEVIADDGTFAPDIASAIADTPVLLSYTAEISYATMFERAREVDSFIADEETISTTLGQIAAGVDAIIERQIRANANELIREWIESEEGESYYADLSFSFAGASVVDFDVQAA